MVRVSDGEFQQQWHEIQAMVIAEPVTITHEGRDQMVLMTAEEYNRLKRRDRRVMMLADFTAEDITAIRNVKPSREATAFNHELEE